jgi:hypothetical protein
LNEGDAGIGPIVAAVSCGAEAQLVIHSACAGAAAQTTAIAAANVAKALRKSRFKCLIPILSDVSYRSYRP